MAPRLPLFAVLALLGGIAHASPTAIGEGRGVAPAVEQDPLGRLMTRLADQAEDASDQLGRALGGSLGQIGTSMARSARQEPAYFAGHGGNGRGTSQLVFRLTQTGPYDDLIATSSERWGLDPFLFKGLLLNESELKPRSIGRRRYAVIRGKKRLIMGGSVGIAQFSASGIKGVTEIRRHRSRYGTKVEPFTYRKALDPTKAIPAAAEMLSYYIGAYGRDGGVTAYNTGLVGGRMVKRYGFWRARAMGKLRRAGHVRLQGDRFLLNVLRRTNRLRRGVGLPPLPGPDHDRRPRKRQSRRRTRVPTS